MNSSKKNPMAKSDRKTKAELQTESEKQEKKLVTLRKDLKNLKTKITELEKQEKELVTLRKDLENAKVKITELEKQEKKLVTLHKDLENKNKSLIEQIADLQKTEETFPVYSGSSKASFRIDLYPHEGHYQGKVVHLLTNEKKAFSGLNHKAIADFVNEHLPQSEESFVAPEPVVSVPTKSPVETPNQASKTASIRKFTLVQKGKVQKEKSIPHDQIFQVVLIFDPLKSIFEENLPCPYKISVYAKRMGGGLRKTLGETRGQITSAGEFTATVHCAPLPVGIYRFVAFGTSNIKKDQQESIVQFHESSMFNVT
jgi:hypothetical protein